MPKQPKPETAKRTPRRRGRPENLTQHPGRGHDLDKPYTWPAAPGTPPEIMTVSEAIPRWMRTTGCLWQEAVLACGITIALAETWLIVGGRVARSLAVGRQHNQLSDYEAKCYAFSGAVLDAGAEVVTRWQSILERESRGGYKIVKTSVVEKEIIGRNGQPTGLTERTTTTTEETARPDTSVLRWRMAKMLPQYRDQPSVVVFGDQPGAGATDDDTLARGIADDLRRFVEQPAAIEATSSETMDRQRRVVEMPGAHRPETAGNRPATADSAKDQVGS